MKPQRLFKHLVAVALAIGSKSSAQDFTVLHAFNGTDGGRPEVTLTLSGDTLYGTASGKLFGLKTDGSGFSILHDLPDETYDSRQDPVFICENTIYGTSVHAGDEGNGLVYRINTDGSDYIVLKSLGGTNGSNPAGGVIVDGGWLYGTTTSGGASPGAGTIFKLASDGSDFRVLHNFGVVSSNNLDGAESYATLTLNGEILYGTTWSGTNWLNGRIFKLNTDGSDFTVMHTFAVEEGVYPLGSLLLHGDSLYGTTSGGGTNGFGTIFKINTNGDEFSVVCQIDAGRGRADTYGYGPHSGVLLLGDTIYCVCPNGGTGFGFVFSVKTDGSNFQVIHNLPASGDGSWEGSLPLGGMASDGYFVYGTAAINGSLHHGTVYSLRLPGVIPPPRLSLIAMTNGSFTFGWNADPGASYQVQYLASLEATNWMNLGGAIVAITNRLTATDTPGTDWRRLYRVARLVP